MTCNNKNYRPGQIRTGTVILASLALSAGLCVTGSTWANNAMYPHGYGTKNKAMGGAGMALPREAAAVINNPAVAIAVAGQMQAGISIYHTRANYYTTESSNNGEDGAFTIGPNAIDAEDKYLVQPYMATSALLQEDSAIAVSLYTRAGMNINYRGGTATFDPDGDGPLPVQTRPGTFGDGNANWHVYQTLIDMTYAKQVSEKISLGFTGVLATQGFRANGMRSFAQWTETYVGSGGTELPDNLSNNKRDWAYGAGVKVGLHAQFTPTLSFGVMYQSKIFMTKHKDYSDLLPDGGRFDMPADLKIGLTWQAWENVAFSIDAERIFNSGVDTLGNSGANLLRCPGVSAGGEDVSSCLGGKNGSGLGWQDMNIFRIGGSFAITDRWTLLAGFSFADQPIEQVETSANIMTPYLAEAHYTFGFSYVLSSGAEVNFSAAYSEEESQLDQNLLDPSQNIKIESDQFDFELSYSWRF